MEEYAVSRTDKRGYKVNNYHGSTRHTVDQSGVIKTAYDYYAFGQIKTNYGASSDKYKFTGKERDIETNYDYFGERYYDSKVGRWLSIDPLADKYQGWNPYNYCLNNSLTIIGPDAHDSVHAVDREEIDKTVRGQRGESYDYEKKTRRSLATSD